MKVILIAAITTDGFIARHKDEFPDWTGTEDKKFFARKTKELGTIVMGRTTFETIGRALPGRRMIVLTSQPDKYDVEDVEFTSESPTELVKRLGREGTEGLAVCGGGQIYTLFLEADLIDELVLTIVDIAFGEGISLAETGFPANLEYISSEYLSETASVHHFTL